MGIGNIYLLINPCFYKYFLYVLIYYWFFDNKVKGKKNIKKTYFKNKYGEISMIAIYKNDLKIKYDKSVKGSYFEIKNMNVNKDS